jgi:drug/metabolite transporter (DMT)-like permease
MKPGSIEPINNVSESTMVWWCFIALMGNVGWAIGSFLAPRFAMPQSSYVATFYQLSAGGLILVLIGSLAGESFSDWRNAGPTAWLGWLYLVLVGSIIAYSAYFWLVRNAPIGLTSTYAYVNPVIAIILGIIFLNEKINTSYIVGGSIVLIGVLLVVTNESKRSKK